MPARLGLRYRFEPATTFKAPEGDDGLKVAGDNLTAQIEWDRHWPLRPWEALTLAFRWTARFNAFRFTP